MSETRRLLLVLGCIVCLLAVASALPAADPRLETPGGGDDAAAAGSWEAITDDEGLFSEPPEDGDDPTDDEESPDEPTDEIEIQGALEPGNEITVTIDDADRFAERSIEVDGEPVAETDRFGQAAVEVPYAEEMTIAVPEIEESRTVDVETTATIETGGGAAPDRDLEIGAVVGSTPVEDATVYLDGEAVATTDDDGRAVVSLPESAGPAELRVERDPVAGAETIEVPEPDLEFAGSLLFPGSPASVQVSADDAGVENATVSLESGGEATTDEEGIARLWLPVDDGATVTTEVGTETATATVGNLYLRLTALVVLGPGLVVGGAVTYLRVVAAREGRQATSLSELFVGIASALAGLLAGSRWPSPSRSTGSISLPRPGVGVPSPGLALPSMGRLFDSLRSLGSVTRSGGNGSWSPFGRSTDADRERTADDRSAAVADAPALASEPLEPRGPRAEVRAAWHAFLDRLDLENRETRTPGQIARRALAAGFPARSVRRLVTVVRELEYGDRAPSPDRVATARETAADLIDHDPDEEGSE